jgi:hypothetical protein
MKGKLTVLILLKIKTQNMTAAIKVQVKVRPIVSHSTGNTQTDVLAERSTKWHQTSFQNSP